MKIRRVKLKKKEKKAVYEKHKKSNTKQSKTNEKEILHPIEQYDFGVDVDEYVPAQVTNISIVDFRQKPWKINDENFEAKTDNQYIVPTEYLYIDGIYSSLMIDEKFESMVFSHSNSTSLQLRVSNKDTDNDTVMWCIVDMQKEKVWYQAKGYSLLIPPNDGWIRLIDKDSWNHDAHDADVVIKTHAETDEDAKLLYDLPHDSEQKEILQTDNTDFIPKIYQCIAQSFCMNSDENTKSENVELLSSSALDRYYDKKTDWVCFHCGNYNHASYIGTVMNNTLKQCTLCGIKEIDSIIMKIKGNNSYNALQISTIDDSDNELTESKYDNDAFNSYLICPQELNGTNPCKYLLRLQNNLSKYQQWLKKIKEKKKSIDINSTTNVNVLKLDKKSFLDILVKSAKKLNTINAQEIEKLTQMITNDILTIEMFLKRKTFLNTVRNNTSISTGKAARMYRTIKQYLYIAAQTKQFGEFLTTTNAHCIDTDYYHILKYHMNDQYGGNTETRDAVFEYFQSKIICDIKDCSSRFRNDNSYRAVDYKETKQYQNEEIKQNNVNNNDNKEEEEDFDEVNTWVLKQRYVQNKLDTIHEYFIHHNFNKNDPEEQLIDTILEEDENKIEMVELQKLKSVNNGNDNNSLMNEINKDKYVTDATNITKYGFGIDHYYPHLQPKYSCIKEEIIKNSLKQIS
eukprot:489618_1